MFTPEEKIDIVNQSLKDMVDYRPYSQIIKDDNFVQILTESDRSILRNAVFWSVLSERNADEKVKQIVAMYRKKQLIFRWVVGPCSEPKNLVEILIKNGFQKVPNGFPGAGMIATYDTVKNQTTLLNQLDFSMQVVENEEQIDNFVGIMESCFRFTVKNDQFLRIAISDDIQAQPRRIWYFLVCYNDAPIGILVARTYNGRFAYLSAGAVLSKYRRKGALKFLGNHVMDFLREKGVTTVTTQTLPNTSEDLCRKLGFESVCQVDTLLCLFNS